MTCSPPVRPKLREVGFYSRSSYATLQAMADDSVTRGVPQFGTAEYRGEAGVDRCKTCGQAISGSYYRVNGAMTCSHCLEETKRRLPQDSHAAFMRGLLFGGDGRRFEQGRALGSPYCMRGRLAAARPKRVSACSSRRRLPVVHQGRSSAAQLGDHRLFCCPGGLTWPLDVVPAG